MAALSWCGAALFLTGAFSFLAGSDCAPRLPDIGPLFDANLSPCRRSRRRRSPAKRARRGGYPIAF